MESTQLPYRIVYPVGYFRQLPYIKNSSWIYDGSDVEMVPLAGGSTVCNDVTIPIYLLCTSACESNGKYLNS